MSVWSAGANIGVILISSIAWGSCVFECDTLRVVRPAQLLFPAYDEEVLTKVRLMSRVRMKFVT